MKFRGRGGDRSVLYLYCGDVSWVSMDTKLKLYFLNVYSLLCINYTATKLLLFFKSLNCYLGEKLLRVERKISLQ